MFGEAGGTTCDAGTDAAVTLICGSGTCGPCAASPGASPRFVDNGNGTITDRSTCLVWEKKDNAGGIHDLNNIFPWSSTGTAMDGGAFTVFLGQLNSTGFGEHSDWRLPTSAGTVVSPTGQPPEIESIVDTGVTGCFSGAPCVDPAFNTNCGTNSGGHEGCTVNGAGGTQECSCTVPNDYWSMSAVSANPTFAWGEDFSGGGLDAIGKTLNFCVRAVRGGL